MYPGTRLAEFVFWKGGSLYSLSPARATHGRERGARVFEPCVRTNSSEINIDCVCVLQYLYPCEVCSGLIATAGGPWNRFGSRTSVRDPSIVGLAGSFPRVHTRKITAGGCKRRWSGCTKPEEERRGRQPLTQVHRGKRYVPGWTPQGTYRAAARAPGLVQPLILLINR